MSDTRYTPSGVRMRRHAERPGELNWLLLPGGPGIGSESLHELADALGVPGTLWLVDLPGDGSNTQPGALRDGWHHVLVEAAQAVPHAVYVGHSTGGMYLLDTPELRDHVVGLGLLDSAPDASWRSAYVAMTEAHPIPGFAEACAAFEAEPSRQSLAALVVLSAPWNFEPGGLAAGRELLGRMPYSVDTMAWSDAHFDSTYVARWWPDVPVLRLAGERDRIVSQVGWEAPAYQTANVIERRIPGAGHFPWIENPVAVRKAFDELARSLVG